MARKKGKSISFDAMVKFFLKNYNIPTTKDVEKLTAKVDRLESLVKSSLSAPRGRSALDTKSSRIKTSRRKSGSTASDMVLDTLKKFKQGAGFAEIQTKTGFDEKKIRNIIFRLNKIGKIKRKNRGIYIVS
jgi:hypothetical protein